MNYQQRSKCRSACLLVVAAALSSFTAGCQSIHHSHSISSHPVHHSGVEVRHGCPNAVIDGVGWIVGIPNKLALWDRRADNHAVSPATETALVRYMNHNELNDVLVRVNQYDPLGEWGRLFTNKRIHPGWRFTVGLYNNLEYTLLPGRILGGDWYNPFTNTLNVYSDLPPLVLSRVAYAKDVRNRDHSGFYAATQELPIIGLVHETIANQDVLAYLARHGNPQELREGRRILYPDYGGSWGAQLASFVPFGSSVGRLVGAAVGHTTNAVRGSHQQTGEATHCDRVGCAD